MGFVAAALYNKYHNFRMPEMLSFFGGARFVPIITAVYSVGIGLILSFIWPMVQEWIYALGAALSGENTPPFYMSRNHLDRLQNLVLLIKLTRLAFLQERCC